MLWFWKEVCFLVSCLHLRPVDLAFRICPGQQLAKASFWFTCALSLATLEISKAIDENGLEITPEFETLKCDFTLPIKLRHVYITSSKLNNTNPHHQVQDNKLVHGHGEDLPGSSQKSKVIELVGEKAAGDKRREWL